MSEETLEQKYQGLEAKFQQLEARFQDEVNRVYGEEWALFDSRLDAFHARIEEVRANAEKGATSVEDRVIAAIKELRDSVANTVTRTVGNLIAGSHSEGIARALASTVLVMRPASREEAKNGNVLVVRQQTIAEQRGN
jgi:oligoendopeptidase F